MNVEQNLDLKRKTAIKEISECAGAGGMIGGQTIDITFTKEKFSEEIINELIAKKTGALIMASVKTGAILGKATAAQLEVISEYGKNIGFAFQIRDDILDYSTGKKGSIGSEPNYVALFGLEESKRRLGEFVETSLDSEELRFLAQMLLNLEKRGNG